MFILEHRYYGKSRPVPDLSVKNLAWLSSHQVKLQTSIHHNKTLGMSGPV